MRRKNIHILIFILTLLANHANAQNDPPVTSTRDSGERVYTDPEKKEKKDNKEKTSAQPQKENMPPVNEKKRWAIQITQGEKWYQLSIDLIMH